MPSMLETLLLLNKAGIRPGNLPTLPRPAMPVPLGPLQPPNVPTPFMEPMPEAAPMAPAPALDEALISRIAGPAPVAPTLQQPGKLETIAAIFGGVGAGLQGQGPQYVEALRERREQPRREYEAKKERYESRRAQGVEMAERKRERAQEQTQRRADIQSEREFETWAQRGKLVDDEARRIAREAFELNKIREQERVADEKQAAKEAADREKQRRDIEHELATKDGAPSNIAREISEYRVGMRDALSPAAEKWRGLQARKLQAQIARLERVGAGGGGASNKGLVEVVDAQGNVLLGPVPYSQIKFNQFGMIQGFPQDASIRQAGGQPQAQPPAFTGPNFFPEVGSGTLPGSTGKTIKMADVQRNAKKAGISVTKAIQEFKDAGYTVQQ